MTDNERWNAVIGNNADVDGLFYYAVKSTGIFCRPSCKSKKPVRENVMFFDCREDAIASGFRPCKRCRPELLDYQPLTDVAILAKNVIEQYHSEKQQLADEFQKLGVSKRRIAQIFKQEYGVSPTEYANHIRIQNAKEQLQHSTLSIIDIAYSLGYESLSAFFTFFRKNTGITPKEYRNHKGKPSLLENSFYGVYDTTFGQITIVCNGFAIVAVQFGNQMCGIKEKRTELTDKTAFDINEYFSGRRKDFDIRIAPQGTQFQRNVWDALCQIPYGETRTYKEIAKAIGNPKASRAVGMANNKNPILLLIPCHRVIGANGSLVGYAGGIDMKEKLLQLEQSNKLV